MHLGWTTRVIFSFLKSVSSRHSITRIAFTFQAKWYKRFASLAELFQASTTSSLWSRQIPGQRGPGGKLRERRRATDNAAREYLRKP